MYINVSEQHTGSIFRVPFVITESSTIQGGAKVACHHLLSLNTEYQIILSLPCTNKTTYYIPCTYVHKLYICICMYVCMCVCVYIYIYIYIYMYFPHDSTTLLGLGLLTSGRVITPSQRPLPYNTQLSQGTGFHVPSENQTRNTSKRPAAEPGLRPRGHRDRPVRYHYTRIHWSTSKIHSELRQPDWA